MTAYAWSVELDLPHADALPRVIDALKAEGFGVLTRVDLHDAFQQKLGVGFRPYTVLGACNPPLAHRALSAEPGIGILLPCNVVVEQHGTGSRVWITDPEALFALVGREDVAPIASEVAARLQRVRAALAG